MEIWQRYWQNLRQVQHHTVSLQLTGQFSGDDGANIYAVSWLTGVRKSWRFRRMGSKRGWRLVWFGFCGV
jgi:hypothetical protein